MSLIPRTHYMRDALGALIGDHLDAAERVLKSRAASAVKVQAAEYHIAAAQRGVRQLQDEHGIHESPEAA